MSDTTQWQLTPTEFAWLWHRETRLDAFDYPLPIVIRESRGTPDEYARKVAGFNARFPHGAEQALSAAFLILEQAETRLRCMGSLRDGTQLRVHGAALDRLGVVAHQRTDAATESGTISLTLTPRGQVPSLVCAQLPATEAGRAGRLIGYTPRVRAEQQPDIWGRTADGSVPVEERIRTLVMTQPRSAEGYFVIERGLDQPRPPEPIYTSWIDIEPGRKSSGRYLIDVDHMDTTLTPVTPTTLVQELVRRC
ncbi:hypothetical protein [Nocardia sp. NPDC050413]|uniref:hypothetical protein n=1 Tax=Nocardia sp. NPDC050413 TaxID=3155784 RepID=UPI0033C7091B